jgi:hypothetical protein
MDLMVLFGLLFIGLLLVAGNPLASVTPDGTAPKLLLGLAQMPKQPKRDWMLLAGGVPIFTAFNSTR